MSLSRWVAAAFVLLILSGCAGAGAAAVGTFSARQLRGHTRHVAAACRATWVEPSFVRLPYRAYGRPYWAKRANAAEQSRSQDRRTPPRAPMPQNPGSLDADQERSSGGTPERQRTPKSRR